MVPWFMSPGLCRREPPDLLHRSRHLVFARPERYICGVHSRRVSMMVAISSPVGAQAASQAALQQLKVQQAKQTAERAEVTARSLRSQAEDAQRSADRAHENARSLFVRSDQAQTAAGQARQGLAMMNSASNMQASLANTASQLVERSSGTEPVGPRVELQASTGPQVAPPVQAPARPSAPVFNTSGQLTGQLVNDSA